MQYAEMQAGGVSGLDRNANWTFSTVTVLKPRERDSSLAWTRRDRFCLHSTRQRLKEQYWDTEIALFRQVLL